jgi:hypothetical protein
MGDYRICIAIPQNSETLLSATVLDHEGKVASHPIGLEGEGKFLILAIKPKRSGIYVIAVRQSSSAGKAETVPCCILTGYK